MAKASDFRKGEKVFEDTMKKAWYKSSLAIANLVRKLDVWI